MQSDYSKWRMQRIRVTKNPPHKYEWALWPPKSIDSIVHASSLSEALLVFPSVVREYLKR